MIDLATDLGLGEMGEAAVAARDYRCEIVAAEPVMGDSSLLTLTAPAGLASGPRPGQFVDILCRIEGATDPLLRRPYSVFRVNPRLETLSVLIRPYGRGSSWLAARQVGETLDVLAPLGNSFTIPARSRNLLLVGGGVGVAPLVFLADHAVARGANVTLLMGAQTADALLGASWFPTAVEYLTATEDGSGGHHGYVTDLVPERLRWADQVYAVGPEPMFRALRRVAQLHRLGGKPAIQVSVERTMACGLGACLGCVVETRSGLQTSCVQGPIYDMDELVWE